MSADNYILIRRRSDGAFVPVMGFASDDGRPVVADRHGPGFATLGDAFDSVADEYTEYGVSADPECYLSDDDFELLIAGRQEKAETLEHILRYRLEDQSLADVAAQIIDLTEEWFTRTT